jgi:hypothetical protein
VRLIYRVGLSDAEIANINASKSVVDRKYYVGAYNATAGTSAVVATATFKPAVSDDGLVDTYYFTDEGYVKNFSAIPYAKATDANVSKTLSNVLTEKNTGVVTQVLGNNGVLEVKRTPTLTITKQWPNGEPQSSSTVYFDVYRVKLDTGGGVLTDGGKLVTDWAHVAVDRSGTGAWVGTFNAPTEETDSNGNVTATYTYYLVEDTVSGYAAQYYAEGVTSGTLGAALTETQLTGVVGSVWELNGDAVVLNYQTYTLPSSGGPGVGAPVAAGCALATLSLAALTALRHRRIRRA